MHHRQPHRKHLPRFEEMSEIGPGVVAASGTGARLINRVFVKCIFGIIDIDNALLREQLSVARVSGRHYAGNAR